MRNVGYMPNSPVYHRSSVLISLSSMEIGHGGWYLRSRRALPRWQRRVAFAEGLQSRSPQGRRLSTSFWRPGMQQQYQRSAYEQITPQTKRFQKKKATQSHTMQRHPATHKPTRGDTCWTPFMVSDRRRRPANEKHQQSFWFMVIAPHMTHTVCSSRRQKKKRNGAELTFQDRRMRSRKDVKDR